VSADAAIAAAYVAACRAELAAIKPGNVHAQAAGHGMTVADFEMSAEASAPFIADPERRVGSRIRGAIEATWAAVKCNTNLGIVLLCAPLAAAAQSRQPGNFRARLGKVLEGLDQKDAELAYAAIRLANPGGLGESEVGDVRHKPEMGLRAAMGLAAARDRIARQYASGFADVFEVGVAEFKAARARWGNSEWATTQVYLEFLARFPDSHVARKHGAATAERVRAQAQDHAARFRRVTRAEDALADLPAFDAALKGAGINPGTSADLTVAVLFAEALERLRA
jgi:triphosphoribosyl-dephospho-CoA synthase